MDSKNRYIVDEKTISDLNISQGKELSKAEIEKIKVDDEINRGKKFALFLLSKRDYTKYEMSKKLNNKGFSEISLLEVLGWLEENKYIDDESFAFSYAQYRLENKPMGIYRLNYELKTKGIDLKIRQKIINNIYRDIDELALARKIATKKISQIKSGNQTVELKKIYYYLIRNGFSSEISRTIYFELADDKLEQNKI